jgi:hypothetical protein
MLRVLAFIAKFSVVMLVMTVACTFAWDDLLNGKVYSCTDGGAMDYLCADGWVHAHNGYPVVEVPKIIPPHDMSAPDTILRGWSVAGLWGVWISFFTLSLAVSAWFAWVPWIKTLDRFAERHSNQATAA